LGQGDLRKKLKAMATRESPDYLGDSALIGCGIIKEAAKYK
jgi:hypothetical protein